MIDYVSLLVSKNPELFHYSANIRKAINKIIACYKNGKKVMVCGNGIFSADSSHFVNALMKSFLKDRSIGSEERAELRSKNQKITDEFLNNLQCGLPAINLSESTSLLTAFYSGESPNFVYAQEVFNLGKKGDVLICISAMGNEDNLINAAEIAKGMGITVISLTGEDGGKLKKNSNICISVPLTEPDIIQEAYRIQETLIPIYHTICAAVEDAIFD